MKRAAFKPLFVADWDDVTFVHYAFARSALQPLVPFELDLFDGAVYVSLVAFTQRRLRPRLGGRLAAALAAPLASHEFLNVRTYVRHGGERGIHFLCEWIPNRLATWMGPPLYGLPYRLGRLRYRYDRLAGAARHEVIARGERLAFDAFPDPTEAPAPARAGTLDAFLLERYVAFTRCRGRDACFRVDHDPWPQRRALVCVREHRLLSQTGLPWDRARLVGGNFSEGVQCVGLGPPMRIGR
ncbi:MAG TPA: DUF2071 domain-containing protein [Tepidisphaeraceae bacterium]